MTDDNDTRTIVRRKDAKASGSVQYFTGKPCQKGHVAPRTTSNGNCLACAVIKSAKWRIENPEKSKEVAKRHYRKHWSKRREENKAWLRNNRERRRIQRRKHCLYDRAYSKKWHKEHPERTKELAAKSYKKNKPKRALEAKLYRAKNLDKVKARIRKWNKDNPDKRRAGRHRRKAKKLGNGGSCQRPYRIRSITRTSSLTLKDMRHAR